MSNDTPEPWRRLADRARASAQPMGNPNLKNAMEQIALAYERIAADDAERLALAWRARELREQ